MSFLAIIHGNGFCVQWVRGEHRGHEPRSGNRKARKQAPEKHGVCEVNQNINHMIARGENPQSLCSIQKVV